MAIDLSDIINYFRKKVETQTFFVSLHFKYSKG